MPQGQQPTITIAITSLTTRCGARRYLRKAALQSPNTYWPIAAARLNATSNAKDQQSRTGIMAHGPRLEAGQT
jgi:hypothetical protein